MKFGPIHLKSFSNIVFSGGGVKAILSFVGTIKALEHVLAQEKIQLQQQFHGFAGTSMGSLICTFLAMGYSGQEMEDYLMECDLEKVSQDICLAKFYQEKGLSDGRLVKEWISEALVRKGYSPTITFKEMFEKTGKELIMFTTHLNHNPHPKSVTLSADTFPNLQVVEAILMSSALPFFFVPRTNSLFTEPEIKQGSTEYYVDGGMIYNFPFHAFGSKKIESSNEKESMNINAFLAGCPILPNNLKSSTDSNHGSDPRSEASLPPTEKKHTKKIHQELQFSHDTLGFFIEFPNFAHRNMESNLVFMRSIIEAPYFLMDQIYMEHIPEQYHCSIFQVPDANVDTMDFNIPVAKRKSIIASVYQQMMYSIQSRASMGTYVLEWVSKMVRVFTKKN